MLPTFDSNGNLPPGIHKPALSLFKERFVTDFRNSKTRNKIYLGYISYCIEISSYGVASINWVAGSFTTNKLDPGDIDIVVHVNFEKHRSLIDSTEFELKFLNYDQIKKEHCCHTFYVPMYPKDDPRYQVTIYHSELWREFFSQDRRKNERGLIEFDLSSKKHQELIKKEAHI